MKKSISLLLISVLLISMFSSGVLANTNASAQNLSGEEIFKGIAFGVGELGGHLASKEKDLQDLNHNKEALETIDQIVQEMNNVNPHYFKNLQKAAYSKNPVKIDNILQDGGVILKEAMDNLGMMVSANQEADPQAVVAGWIAMIGALAYNYAGAVHTAAAAVNAAAYLNLWVYQNAYLWGGNSESSQLDREMYILDVIEALE